MIHTLLKRIQEFWTSLQMTNERTQEFSRLGQEYPQF